VFDSNNSNVDDDNDETNDNKSCGQCMAGIL